MNEHYKETEFDTKKEGEEYMEEKNYWVPTSPKPSKEKLAETISEEAAKTFLFRRYQTNLFF